MTFAQVMKVIYFADKIHLTRFGRPISGDTYIRMEHGPVPSIAYNMLKLDAFLDEDILLAIQDSITVRRDGEIPHVYCVEDREIDQDVFSRTDLECLEESVSKYGSMSMSSLRRITHQELAWIEAPANGPMDYALMIDDEEVRMELEKELVETASQIEL